MDIFAIHAFLKQIAQGLLALAVLHYTTFQPSKIKPCDGLTADESREEARALETRNAEMIPIANVDLEDIILLIFYTFNGLN